MSQSSEIVESTGSATLTSGEAAAPRGLLLLGQTRRDYHNLPEHWGALGELFRGAGLSQRWITDDVSALEPGFLRRFDVILNYSTRLEPASEQVGHLVHAVEQGVGYVGLHAASATFLTNPAYLQMLGAQLHGHPPIKRFTVEFVDRDHPITSGLERYDHEDERYELTGDLTDPKHVLPVGDVRVLAVAEGHPMVYVTQHGAGRVVYLASGHDRRSLDHPTYRMLFNRAIAWAAQRL